MLDHMLEVAYEEKQQDTTRQEMVDAFMHFPKEELHKIACGEEKLGCGSSEDEWLDKFKGTPMYDQALALEEQQLKLDIAGQQSRRQERAGRDQLWDARDAIRLQKRMLELQLRKSQEGDGGELEEEEAPEVPESPEVPTEDPQLEEKTSAVNDLYSRRMGELQKLAGEMKAAKEKAAAMGPLRSADYWEDPIAEAAAHHQGGKISPEAMQMMQQQARGDIESQTADQLESAKYIKDHPVKGRLPGAALGGGFGAIMGGIAGASPMAQGMGLSGKGALVGGGLGALAGAALTPGHRARMAEHAQMTEASEGLNDPALQHALMRSAGVQQEDRQHRQKLERSQAKGENAAYVSQGTELLKSKKASVVADVWGREMAKQAMTKAAHSALEKVAAEQLEDMSELELTALGEMAKAAEARVEAGVEFDDLLDFEKVAIMGAVRGIGQFLGAAGKGVASAAKAGHAAGGLKGAVTGAGGALKRVGQLGGGLAEQAIKKSPLTGAAVTGGVGLAAGGMLGQSRGRKAQTTVNVQR